jgi:RHS repeat-associated protein
MLSLKVDGVGARYPLYDGVGSTRRLVDSSNNHTDTYSLDAFGEEFASATGSTHNPYRFGGAWGYITDPSGMLQLGARSYWPEIGRFIQQDPIGDGLNWYGYAYANPVRYIDPQGLDSITLAGYALVGGEVTIGWDPCTGLFLRTRVGFGAGAGFSYDPYDVADTALSASAPVRHGSYVGAYRDQVVAIGPWDLYHKGGSRGSVYDAYGNEYEYFDVVRRGRADWAKALRLKVGLTFGAEGAVF